MNSPLSQKVILVTGASSGIGRATCRELARQGAFVVLLARNEAGMRETMALMPESQCLALAADLRVLSALPLVLKQAWGWQGRIDGCVYCAGIGGRAKLRDTTPEFMTERMLINCIAFVETMRVLVSLKKKAQFLQVATISSFAALGHDKYFTAYAASKAALEAAVKTLAVELRSRNTRINIIRPAFVNTPMVSNENDPLGDFATRLEESGYQPLGLIPPEEVAQMAAYLMSPAAVRISGVVFPINAGVPC